MKTTFLAQSPSSAGLLKPNSLAVRARVTSATSMSLGRNTSRSRPTSGKGGRRGRGGCGGTPGGASGTRSGSRAAMRARGRRSSFGDGGGGGTSPNPMGFWEAGDVIWGSSGRGGRGGARRAGARKDANNKPYQMHRTGGTFSAKGAPVVIKMTLTARYFGDAPATYFVYVILPTRVSFTVPPFVKVALFPS